MEDLRRLATATATDVQRIFGQYGMDSVGAAREGRPGDNKDEIVVGQHRGTTKKKRAQRRWQRQRTSGGVDGEVSLAALGSRDVEERYRNALALCDGQRAQDVTAGNDYVISHKSAFKRLSLPIVSIVVVASKDAARW